jgi:SAM-dependent methyltransferase
MLPLPFADFAFVHDAAGGDAALAARVVRSAHLGVTIVLGAGRPALLEHLVRSGASVVGVDASRSTLRRARSALTDAGVLASVTLFAADARDVEVPGGCDAALIPALLWRALPTSVERQAMLRCLARTVAPDGRVCLDLDRIPGTPPPGARWARVARQRICVRADADGAEVELHVADVSPESALVELEQAGLSVVSAVDATTGAPWSVAGTRLFAVARPAGAT